MCGLKSFGCPAGTLYRAGCYRGYTVRPKCGSRCTRNGNYSYAVTQLHVNVTFVGEPERCCPVKPTTSFWFPPQGQGSSAFFSILPLFSQNHTISTSPSGEWQDESMRATTDGYLPYAGSSCVSRELAAICCTRPYDVPIAGKPDMPVDNERLTEASEETHVGLRCYTAALRG